MVHLLAAAGFDLQVPTPGELQRFLGQEPHVPGACAEAGADRANPLPDLLGAGQGARAFDDDGLARAAHDDG
ncbi:hypothetical protein GCM10020000_85360 [Streptomyces olivoverticillatus]